MNLINKQRTVKLLNRDGHTIAIHTEDGWDTTIAEMMNMFAGREADLYQDGDGEGEFEYTNDTQIYSLLYREDTSDVTYNGQYIGRFIVETTADTE